jgi:hypothetical protein
MQGNFRMRRARMRSGVGAALAALLAWTAPGSAAATPSFAEQPALERPAAREVAPRAARADLERWRGRFCTPAGCPGGREASGAMGAGFAAATLAMLIATRRPRPRD